MLLWIWAVWLFNDVSPDAEII